MDRPLARPMAVSDHGDPAGQAPGPPTRREGRRAIPFDLGLRLDADVRVADDVLLERARGGDEQAFLEFYRRHQDFVWRVARAVTLADDDAAAAVIDAFLHVPDALDGERSRTDGREADPSDPVDGTDPIGIRAILAALTRDAALERRTRRRTDGIRREPSHRARAIRPGGAERRGKRQGRAPVADELLDLAVEETLAESRWVAASQRASHPIGGAPLGPTLRTVVPSPPPELWALVQVAWKDRVVR